MGSFMKGVVVAGRGLVAGIGTAFILLALFPVTGHTASKISVPAPEPPGRYGIDDSLNRIILPAQTPSFVGGQAPPLMEVTPGTRFMHILVSHVALYLDPSTGLGLSSGQRSRLRTVLEKTREELIKTDATDLRLIQLFEASLVRKVVPLEALRSLNIRIGEIEGKEGIRFMTSIRDIQAVLTQAQIGILKEKGEHLLPSEKIELSTSLAFADRILAIRWKKIMGILPSVKSREDLASRYRKARNWMWTLAAEKTVSDRNVSDALAAPFIDLAPLDALEKKAGPLEGKFWETFVRIVTLLNPPSR